MSQYGQFTNNTMTNLNSKQNNATGSKGRRENSRNATYDWFCCCVPDWLRKEKQALIG